jgi:tripartite-type tricarboxylate transporter receptor subunit TctC
MKALKTILRSALLIVAGIAVAANAVAQAYPSKPIRLISPWPAGGPAETIARPVMDQLSAALGQPIVIESKPGANGMLGTSLVAKAAPDGYTLLLSHAGPTAISPALQREMPYDPLADFVHITLVASPTIALLVVPDLPVTTVPELVAYAKANPGKLAYASVGPGSTTHLAGEMLNMMAGIKLLHVPYKGAAPVITDLLGGRVQVAFLGYSAGAPHVKAGKLRAIAVASLKRSSVAPDLPTVSDTYPGFEVNSWYGLAAPAGTPAEIRDRIYTEIARVLRSPEIVERMRATGSEVGGMPPAEFTQKIRDDLALWAKAVKAAGLEKQ